MQLGRSGATALSTVQRSVQPPRCRPPAGTSASRAFNARDELAKNDFSTKQAEGLLTIFPTVSDVASKQDVKDLEMKQDQSFKDQQQSMKESFKDQQQSINDLKMTLNYFAGGLTVILLLS
ncbi:hypothetical protein GPECTOR_811g40 [Gonium pectorale]|uniref:Uncharacterized protein n=1 Tax=Gonium pectorale TaxID=33097 RepID=A0A150FTZ5_GONPE|nr:hypothetical protein GPECTOR_811g40 [Gonium pectorale]|eukprot:KXZ41093.1 hypothetical protein GPECTOR_811g40 [Gonium pectorale]